MAALYFEGQDLVLKHGDSVISCISTINGIYCIQHC